MSAYLARRLLLLPLVMIGVTFLVFGVMQTLPPAARAMLFVQKPEQAKIRTRQACVYPVLALDSWCASWRSGLFTVGPHAC